MASNRGDTDTDPDAEEAALEVALREVPRGTVAVAGTAVGLMMLCWFLIYAFVFLPRGSVG
jgi:hypothetical protein